MLSVHCLLCILITAPFAIIDYFERKKWNKACEEAAEMIIKYPNCNKERKFIINYKLHGSKYARKEA